MLNFQGTYDNGISIKVPFVGQLIIFDEPAQHSIVTSDMESLIQSVLDIEGEAQVIVGITLNNEELKQFIENLPEEDAKIINIGERAFKLF